jgi:hypothetical protein
MICQSCQSINFAPLKREQEPEILWGLTFAYSTFALLQPSEGALQQSAESGCPLCLKFSVALSQEKDTMTISAQSGRFEDPKFLIEDSANDVPPVVLYCRHEHDNDDWLFTGLTSIRCGRIETLYRLRIPVPSKIFIFLRSYC